MDRVEQEPVTLDFEDASEVVTPQMQAAFTQGKWHLLAFLGSVILFAAADSWVTVTSLGIAEGFAILAAIIAGYGIATLGHEWGHYLGAVLSGAKAPLKAEPAVLAYDFDIKNNSNDQFLAMSLGGTLGNIAVILLIWLTIPLDAPHRMALLASSIAAMAFVGTLEWPVIKHAKANKDPMAALVHGFGGGLPTFRKAIVVAVVVGLLSFWII